MLDRAQIEFYREQGYLLVEDVLDEALLARLRQATYDMIERSRAVVASDSIYDLDEGHSAASVRVNGGG